VDVFLQPENNTTTDFSQFTLPFRSRVVKLQVFISPFNFIHPDTGIARWNLSAMPECSWYTG
jgi:hypothetical protein